MKEFKNIAAALLVTSAAMGFASNIAIAGPILGDNTNAFTIVQAAGGAYIPVAGPVACGLGLCITRLTPATVQDLGAMTAANTATLKADLAAQRAAYSIANPGGLGNQLDINFVISFYQAINDGTIGGGQLGVDFTAQRGVVLPANLHWIQIVTDNFNITGVDGNNLAAPTGIGKPENVVDAPNTPASPYYDDSSAANNPAFNTRPPHFEDFSQRTEPNAANPMIIWSADLFLVSDDGTKKITVYDGVRWGWVTTYVPEPSTWAILLFALSAMGVALRGGRRKAFKTA